MASHVLQQPGADESYDVWLESSFSRTPKEHARKTQITDGISRFRDSLMHFLRTESGNEGVKNKTPSPEELYEAMQEKGAMLKWDDRSQMPGKKALLSEKALSAVREQLGDAPLRYGFMDIRHLSVPNKFGNEGLVDMYIEGIGMLVRKHLTEHGFAVRQGGDEFVFILRDTVEAEQAFATFSEDVQKLSGLLFNDDPEDVSPEIVSEFNKRRAAKDLLPVTANELAESITESKNFASLRQALRGPIRDAYNASGVNDYLAFMQQLAEELGVERNERERDEQFILRIADAWMEANAYNEDTALCKPDTVSLPLASLTPENCATALNEADHRIHLQKVGKTPDEEHVDSSLKIEQKRAIEEQAKEDRDPLLAAAEEDTALEPEKRGILSRSTMEYIDIEPGEKWEMVHIDIGQFGVINNSSGYAFADDVLDFMQSYLSNTNPESVLVRGRGGSFYLLTPASQESPFDLESLFNAASVHIQEELQSVDPQEQKKARAEGLERRVLAAHLGSEREFSQVGVVNYEEPQFVEATSSTTLYSLFEQGLKSIAARQKELDAKKAV